MFEQALLASAKKLREACRLGYITSFALIGALAVARWSRPRSTGDIDYVVGLDGLNASSLASYLKAHYRQGDFNDPLLGTITFEEGLPNQSVPIQLLIFPPAWEKVALAEIQDYSISGQPIPFVDWKALVLLKLYAGSALDLEDARAIISNVSPSDLELHYVRTKASALRVSKRLQRVIKDI